MQNRQYPEIPSLGYPTELPCSPCYRDEFDVTPLYEPDSEESHWPPVATIVSDWMRYITFNPASVAPDSRSDSPV